MGLDVAFNRQQALNAGLKLVNESNGTSEQIAEAMLEGDNQYANWLAQTTEYIVCPENEYLVANGGVDGMIVVRANKWGQIYAPLTNWLIANNIQWSEF